MRICVFSLQRIMMMSHLGHVARETYSYCNFLFSRLSLYLQTVMLERRRDCAWDKNSAWLVSIQRNTVKNSHFQLITLVTLGMFMSFHELVLWLQITRNLRCFCSRIFFYHLLKSSLNLQHKFNNLFFRCRDIDFDLSFFESLNWLWCYL